MSDKIVRQWPHGGMVYFKLATGKLQKTWKYTYAGFAPHGSNATVGVPTIPVEVSFDDLADHTDEDVEAAARVALREHSIGEMLGIERVNCDRFVVTFEVWG